MRAPRIYVDQAIEAGAELALSSGAFHHLTRVLRLGAGAPLTLFDGRGGEHDAVLAGVDRRSALVRVGARREGHVESPLQVTLVQAVTRNQRMDLVLQKAVELGVAAIQPVACARGIAAAAGPRRLAHWRGVVVAACEQCGRDRVPPVGEALPLARWLETSAPVAAPLLLDPGGDAGLRGLPRPGGAVHLLVGPEGGLAPAERSAAMRAGYRGVRMGPRVLRTETAGIAALAVVQALWGDLG